jgi:hypothetical protein
VNNLEVIIIDYYYSEGRDKYEDLDVGGRITLKWI